MAPVRTLGPLPFIKNSSISSTFSNDFKSLKVKFIKIYINKLYIFCIKLDFFFYSCLLKVQLKLERIN